MAHARIALYRLRHGSVAAAAAKVRLGLVPLFRAQPGYLGYEIVETGDDTVVSISHWESHEQAQAAVQAAAGWVGENIAELVEDVQNQVGEVIFSDDSG